MKHSGIVLAAVGMLILCVLTLSLISMPGKSPEPPRPTEAEPPLRILADTAPEKPAVQVEQPAPTASATPPAADARPAQTEDGVVTDPDGCVLLGTPRQVLFLPEPGLTLMSNQGGVYVFDPTSGKLVWPHYVTSERGGQGSAIGRRRVLIWSGEDVRLLEAATGREIWSQNNAPYGEVHWALLSPDESRIVANTERQFVVYSVNGAERRVLTRKERSWAWGWLSDGNTLVTVETSAEADRMPDKDEQATQTWKLINADTGETVGTWESSGAVEFASQPSKQGQFLERPKGDEKSSILKLRDVRTGNVVRELKTEEPVTYATWLQDGRRFMSVREDGRALCIIDAETGKTEFSLSKEGHRFSWIWAYNAAPGQEWVMSQDEANNYYAWPVTPDGAPRKVLSGRGIAEGNYYLREPATSYILMSWSLERHLWVHAAYAIEDLRKLAEWRVRGEEEWFMDSMVNQNLTRLVRSHPIDEKKNRGGWDVKNTAFNVYARNNESPVFSGQGRPTAISPDGRYLAVQTEEAAASLYDLDTGIVVQEYHGPPDQEGQVYFFAGFSDDGRRLVTRGSRALEITDLVEGFPKRAMDVKEGDQLGWRVVLSPDGSRVLCAGSRKAWLYDADTGDRLRTFEETERFAQLYGAGFWNGLAARAGDWMGSVSEKFKSGAYVEAVFAEHGTRVITYAAGQIIRIWDADSGSLLRTIHTGLPEQRDKDGNIRNEIEISPNGRFAFSCNMSGFGLGSLWSLSDGARLRQYRLPAWENSWPRTMVLDNASAIYVTVFDNLYRWPGAAE